MDSENKYGVREIQKELLVLLKEFDTLCMKENINYSVSSGTLLGAVRHEGFIPWDDDLDVTVGREDYEKLKTVMAKYPQMTMMKRFWIDRMQLSTLESEKADEQPTMDVFIWDNTPDNAVKAKIKYFTLALLQGMQKDAPRYYLYSFKEKVMAFVTCLMGKPFKKSTLLRWYSQVAQWGNSRPTRYMGGWHDQFNALHFRYDSDMIKKTERRTFEDITVSAFADYDKYLKTIYGDNYMTMPKEEERVPHHMAL